MSASDDKMRELTERLVAMSPEPPPYPEEVIVTVPTKPQRRNPVLVFAGAAAVVLLAAGVPLLLARSSEQPPAGTSVPSPVETTVPPTEPEATTAPVETTAPAQTTVPETTTIPVGTWEHVVYLVESPGNSITGNPALVSFMAELPGSVEDGVAQIAFRSLSLLTNPDFTVPDGFLNLIPSDVEVLGVADSGEGYLIVDMNKAFLDGAGGLLADVTMLNQIVFTATQFGRADAVLFTVNGGPFEAYGTEGIVLDGPVARGDYLDGMNSIIITEPLIFGGDGLPMVGGIANVFEATVSLQIVESESGEVAYEDFTTATCGTGCWGEFTFSLDTPELTPQRSVLVFYYSPKDGEPSDIVRIPVNPDGGWDFLPDQG